MKRFAQLTIVIATAAACGCADADTAPVAGLVGTLNLTAYNGAALPAYVDSRLGACSSMIVAGSLTTASDAHVVFSRSYTAPCAKAPAVAAESRTGIVTVDGTTVTVTLDADALNSPQVFLGTLDGGQLTLHYTVNNLTTPLQQTFLLTRQ